MYSYRTLSLPCTVLLLFPPIRIVPSLFRIPPPVFVTVHSLCFMFLLFVQLMFMSLTDAVTATTTPSVTTTTVPPVTVSIVNNKGSSDPKPEQCEPNNWAAVVFVLEKDKNPNDAHKMYYILCKTYPDITFSAETLVETDPPEKCPGNSALVGVRGEKDDKFTWHDPEIVKGICQNVQGWKINQANCTTIPSPVQDGSKWQKNEFGTGDEDGWNRYFECPHQTLAVQLSTYIDGGKAVFESVLCCSMEPFASPGAGGSGP